MKMSALSPTMASGTIVEWCKKEGELVKANDVVAKIETDKATVDLEAQDEGYLGKILVASGEVAVGGFIGIMTETAQEAEAFKSLSADVILATLRGGGGSAAAAAAPAAVAPSVVTSVASTAAASAPARAPAAAAVAGSRVLASPYAKKIAEAAGIAVGSLPSGTGPNGRVIAADVTEWLASAASRAAVAAPVAAAVAAVSSSAVVGGGGGAAAREGGSFIDTPATNVRKVIASRLTASKQTVPHYYLTSEISLDVLLALRAQLNADLPAENKLSVNDFIIRASALACKKVPEVNSSWLDSVIRTYDYVDISVAVAVPDGLITPIIRDAHIKGLSAINR